MDTSAPAPAVDYSSGVFCPEYGQGKCRFPGKCRGSSCLGKSLEKAGAESAVNHPSHYKSGGMEAIDVIEAFKFNYHVGQVFKYIARYEKKGRPLEDLKKARWYLDREIARMEKP